MNDSADRGQHSSGIQNDICPFCKKEIPSDSRFCIFCGKFFSDRQALNKADSFSDPDCTVQVCSFCMTSVPMSAKYCSKCGKDLKTPGTVPPIPSYIGDDREESLLMQQRILEVIYLQQHGLEPEMEEAGKLFPFGWYIPTGSLKHIKALAEAIDQKILISQTETWNKEMVEGVRD